MALTWHKRQPSKETLLTVGAAGLAGFLIARGAWVYRARKLRRAENDLALEMADAGMYMLNPQTSVELIAPVGEYEKGLQGDIENYDGESYIVRFLDGRQMRVLVGELAKMLKIRQMPGGIHWAFA